MDNQTLKTVVSLLVKVIRTKNPDTADNTLGEIEDSCRQEITDLIAKKEYPSGGGVGDNLLMLAAILNQLEAEGATY